MKVPSPCTPFYARPVLFLVLIVHMLWATLLIRNATALDTTPVHEFIAFGRYGTIFALFGASFMAIYGLNKRSLGPLGWLWFAPQQILLMISATSVLKSVVTQQFADGVERSWEFMLADHPFVLLVGIAHTASLAIIILNQHIHQEQGFNSLLQEKDKVRMLENQVNELQESLGYALSSSGGSAVPPKELWPQG